MVMRGVDERNRNFLQCTNPPYLIQKTHLYVNCIKVPPPFAPRWEDGAGWGGVGTNLAPFGRPPSGQTAITVANMYRFKKCYILARTSLLLLPFRYAATVLYNSNNRMQWGGDFYSCDNQ